MWRKSFKIMNHWIFKFTCDKVIIALLVKSHFLNWKCFSTSNPQIVKYTDPIIRSLLVFLTALVSCSHRMSDISLEYLVASYYICSHISDCLLLMISSQSLQCSKKESTTAKTPTPIVISVHICMEFWGSKILLPQRRRETWQETENRFDRNLSQSNFAKLVCALL